jgi:hypothetical protein
LFIIIVIVFDLMYNWAIVHGISFPATSALLKTVAKNAQSFEVTWSMVVPTGQCASSGSLAKTALEVSDTVLFWPVQASK